MRPLVLVDLDDNTARKDLDKGPLTGRTAAAWADATAALTQLWDGYGMLTALITSARAARNADRAERLAVRFGPLAIFTTYVLPLPSAVVYATLGATGMDVVVEGVAARVDDDATLQRVAAAYDAKYGWPVTIVDGAFDAPYGAPTAGPPPYEVLDAILEGYVEQDLGREQLVARGLAAADVDRVIRLVDLAEYKRRQQPPGIKVTSKAFGRDRRMPITNRYGG